MSGKQDNGDYEIGRNRPPKHSQFKKGQSGNLKGRPPKRPPDASSIVAILDAEIDVRKGGKAKRMSAFEASVRKLASRAINEGNVRAARKFLEFCDQYEVFTPAPEPRQNSILLVPLGQTESEWMANVEEALAAFPSRKA